MQAYIAGYKIAGYSDWPDKMLIVYFAGSNFNQPHSVKELNGFNEEYVVDLREVTKVIEDADVPCVVFSGGEPTLQKQQLISLLKFSKNLGLKTGIETNGSKANLLNFALGKELVDFLYLNIDSSFDKECFERVTRSKTFFIQTKEIMNDVLLGLNVIKRYHDKINVEVRTAVVPGLMYRKEDILEIAKVVSAIKCTWVLQKFIPSKGLLDKKIESIKSPSTKFLENLKNSCLKEYPDLKIEIRDTAKVSFEPFPRPENGSLLE